MLPDVKRPFAVPESLYPFESRWCEVEGIPVHYVDEGQGQPILFLHGNPTWSFLYRDIIRALRGKFRCLALDYPGMGMSGKPRDFGQPTYGFTPREHSRIVQGFVEKLDLGDLGLMVQDWGGPIGIGMATRVPDRISHLIIGNTCAWPMTGPAVWMFSNGLGRGLGRQLILRQNLFVERILPAAINDKSRLSRDVMAAYRGPYPTPKDREPTAVFPREILGSRDYLEEVERSLHHLAKKPVQLVWGTDDQAFTKRELIRWQELYPDARVRLLRGANHFIQEDAPEGIAESISSFFASA